MVVPQTTYIRLIYSAITTPPPSCVRNLTGLLSYQVRGWFMEADNIGFLVPMTIVNLASFVLLLVAVFNAKRGDYKFDPLTPNALLSASCDTKGQHIKWEDKVEYGPEVRYSRDILQQ